MVSQKKTTQIFHSKLISSVAIGTAVAFVMMQSAVLGPSDYKSFRVLHPSQIEYKTRKEYENLITCLKQNTKFHMLELELQNVESDCISSHLIDLADVCLRKRSTCLVKLRIKLSEQPCEPSSPYEFGGSSSQQDQAASLSSLTMS